MSSINQDQFIYFMHILMCKRRGRPIPSGIPLDLKELFLKDTQEENGPYIRPNDNSRDVGSLANKDIQHLKDELRRLEEEISNFVPNEADQVKLKDLELTKNELLQLLNYKKNQSVSLGKEKDSVRELHESGQESIHSERLKNLFASLNQEMQSLEQKKSEVRRELDSI